MIYFTKHAKEKFRILEEHGFKVSKDQVIATIKQPDLIDSSRLPLLIAQGGIDPEHVLRVVYREENRDKIIITFYPGRRKDYEK